MSKLFSYQWVSVCFMALASFVPVFAQTSIQLSPGDDIQAAVNIAPAGSKFLLGAGTYRMQTVVPKANDTFTGQGLVVFNGAALLTFAADTQIPGQWVASAKLYVETRGVCDATHPLCKQDQDLFITSVYQTPATSRDNLQPGQWYFDQANGKVYLPRDPGNSVVEISNNQFAFYGTASGVQISNLTVEKYLTSAQRGAIGGDGNNSGWIVNAVEVRWNHGTGVELGASSQVLNSFIHHNGCTGIKFFGKGGQILQNEISWNNYAGFAMAWEGGGTKLWATTNLRVQSNYVHDNKGKGLWGDTNNVGTLYIQNTVMNNADVGIQHEVSYSAVIRNNDVEGNNPTPNLWVGAAQIRIDSSPNVEVYSNRVVVAASGGNGIAVINTARGSGPLGPWTATNDNIHNNTIIYLGDNGLSGYENDGGAETSALNTFNVNRYIFSGPVKRWRWIGGVTWSGMQGLGQEATGTCCN